MILPNVQAHFQETSNAQGHYQETSTAQGQLQETSNAQARRKETFNVQGQLQKTYIAQSQVKETSGAQTLQTRDFYLFTNINKIVLALDLTMVVKLNNVLTNSNDFRISKIQKLKQKS